MMNWSELLFLARCADRVSCATVGVLCCYLLIGCLLPICWVMCCLNAHRMFTADMLIGCCAAHTLSVLLIVLWVLCSSQYGRQLLLTVKKCSDLKLMATSREDRREECARLLGSELAAEKAFLPWSLIKNT